MLVAQPVKFSNKFCVQVRHTRDSPTTSSITDFHQTEEMKKFRNHHSTLSSLQPSAPGVMEMDMKNIELTYFLVFLCTSSCLR